MLFYASHIFQDLEKFTNFCESVGSTVLDKTIECAEDLQPLNELAEALEKRTPLDVSFEDGTTEDSALVSISDEILQPVATG